MRSLPFFCLCLRFAAFAGPADSLVLFSDLNFKNDHEKTTFRNYQLAGNKADVIDLFMTHYSRSESYSPLFAHQRIHELVEELKKETEGLSEQKKVKHIYKKVHERFFKIYQNHNSFPDVFEKGEYNCVSGSAMYAIVFQLMDIPYQVVEAPQHVFLFAYPQTFKIGIETTSPKNGYMSFSEAYIQRYILYMMESKLIRKEEVESTSASALFDKYYFSKKGLSIQELAGIQYDNYAYYYLEAQEHEKALQEAKKAYYISSTNRSSYLFKMALLQMVSNRSYKEKKDFQNLALLCRMNHLNENDVSDEAIRQEFGRLTYEQLINHTDYALYDEAFSVVDPAIKDSVLKSEVAFIYHYELARMGLNNFKSREYELPHLRAAYAINPKHADLRLIIKGYLARLMENNTNDDVSILKDLDTFAASFGFLNEDNSFNQVKANYYLQEAYQDFMLENSSTGTNSLQKFEALSAAHPDMHATERFVEKAYSTAATYYFKKGNKPKARELLKKGISYAPDNFGLKLRLSQVH